MKTIRLISQTLESVSVKKGERPEVYPVWEVEIHEKGEAIRFEKLRIDGELREQILRGLDQQPRLTYAEWNRSRLDRRAGITKRPPLRDLS